jgi:DNA-binding response OmpR family regulator
MTKILLVEDDKNLREIYGVRLLAEGYDIISAGDGEEALAMAIKERPDLIISDVMMPKISGFDMLDILRSTTETKNIRVIIMTALSSEDQRARGEALGADRYLVKSQVGIEDVVRAVHDVLKDTQAEQATPQEEFGIPGPTAVSEPQQQPQAQPQTEQQQPQVDQASSFINNKFEQAQTTSPSYVLPQNEQHQEPVKSAPVVQPRPNFGADQPRWRGAIEYPYNAPQRQESPLPQPTAQFSTPRPANFGERVIKPLSNIGEDQSNYQNMMNKELNSPYRPDNQNQPNNNQPNQ